MPRRRVNVKQQIILAFHDNEQLTWNKLLEKTGVSKGSLSKYLNKMIDIGIVEPDIDTSTRPPSVVYRNRLKKISLAIDWHSVAMKTRLPDYKARLQRLKTLAENERQKEFNRIFTFALLNLLADHLSAFEAGLTVQRHSKTKESAGEAYFYIFHENFAHTAKAIFELFSGDDDYVKLFSRSVDDVIWIAEKIRPEGEKPSDINQVIGQIVSKLQIERKGK